MQEKNSTCQKWRHQSNWREFVPATGPPPLKLQLLLQHYTHARGQGRAPVNYLSWFSESPPGGSIFTKHAGEFRASKLKECVQILVFPCFPLKHVDINVWTVDVNKQPRANKQPNKQTSKQTNKYTNSPAPLSFFLFLGRWRTSSFSPFSSWKFFLLSVFQSFRRRLLITNTC